jgi:hypothetical protein
VEAGRWRFRGLVAALRIDRECADQLAVFGDHPIVGLRDDQDWLLPELAITFPDHIAVVSSANRCLV